MTARLWTRDELLIAFSLYCRLPFGRYHRGNPDVRRVAEAIGRTPSSVAMRLSNFASLDPLHQNRGVKGLGSTGPALQAFWREVHQDWTRAAVESELAWERVEMQASSLSDPGLRPHQQDEASPPSGPTETSGRARVRLVQGFFRRTVLTSYGGACAICGIRPSELLTAGHIIPWSMDESRRADPTNGLSLCALHDRAFDAGLLALDENLRVVVSSKLAVEAPSRIHEEALTKIHGHPLTLPARYHPDSKALEWHREQVFVA